MNSVELGMSVPLGFWTKHCEAMDAIYDNEDNELDSPLPTELAAIRSDERLDAQLTRLISAAEDDCDRLLNAIDEGLQRYARADSRLKLKEKKIRHWSKRVEVRAKRDRSKMYISLGPSIETGSKSGLAVQCTLWTPGGKAAEERNANTIRGVTNRKPLKGCDDDEMTWGSGDLVLFRVPFSDHLTNDSVPLLDEEAVVSRLLAGVSAACPAELLFAILKSGH